MAPVQTKDEHLLKLYELAINEEHYFLDRYQKLTAFYSGILSALMVGIGVGFFRASQWYHFAFLCIVPILIFAVSRIAVGAIRRTYQSFLETITVRAKLEQQLGLTSSQLGRATTLTRYWRSEPIIPHRHIESRKKYKSSNAFIKAELGKGYHLWTRVLFLVFQCASIAMLALMLFLAIRNC